jgi:hypothetical protein
LDLPIDVCKERNRGRDRLVPESVIDSMATDLAQSPPDVSDGLAVGLMLMLCVNSVLNMVNCALRCLKYVDP